MSPRLNLDAVQSFSVFADSMNFSAAAAALYISQPALHVKIRKLAEQLGLPLYTRLGRRLALTTPVAVARVTKPKPVAQVPEQRSPGI